MEIIVSYGYFSKMISTHNMIDLLNFKFFSSRSYKERKRIRLKIRYTSKSTSPQFSTDPLKALLASKIIFTFPRAKLIDFPQCTTQVSWIIMRFAVKVIPYTTGR